MWYCVVRIQDYQLLYLGRDVAAAKEAAKADGFCAEAPRPGDAQIKAAKAAGSLNRQRRAPNGR